MLTHLEFTSGVFFFFFTLSTARHLRPSCSKTKTLL